MEELLNYKFLLMPLIVWFGIQLFKTFYCFFETKKWDWSRLWGSGGMPSSHSAVVTCLAATIGKAEGFTSPVFAVSAILAFIVMYDAAGVRRAVGKQAKVLNDILSDVNKTSVEKLQEMTGHTPVQVATGAIIGIIVGLLF